MVFPRTRICFKDSRRARHGHELFSLVADGFEHETSARNFNVYVGFEVKNGGDGGGRCGWVVVCCGLLCGVCCGVLWSVVVCCSLL